MDLSPETLRELAQYLRNTARLFPTPQAKKAFKWLTTKAAEIDEHADAWEVDRKRLSALRQMAQEQTDLEGSEIDTFLADTVSAPDEGEVMDGI